jgi:hypothetical protein
MNQSKLFDPFTKNHGSLMPLILLTLVTTSMSIVAIETLGYLLHQEAEKVAERSSFFPNRNASESK